MLANFGLVTHAPTFSPLAARHGTNSGGGAVGNTAIRCGVAQARKPRVPGLVNSFSSRQLNLQLSTFNIQKQRKPQAGTRSQTRTRPAATAMTREPGVP